MIISQESNMKITLEDRKLGWDIPQCVTMAEQ